MQVGYVEEDQRVCGAERASLQILERVQDPTQLPQGCGTHPRTQGTTHRTAHRVDHLRTLTFSRILEQRCPSSGTRENHVVFIVIGE